MAAHALDATLAVPNARRRLEQQCKLATVRAAGWNSTFGASTTTAITFTKPNPIVGALQFTDRQAYTLDLAITDYNGGGVFPNSSPLPLRLRVGSLYFWIIRRRQVFGH